MTHDRQQALDAQGHLLETPGRVQAGAGEEAQVRRAGLRWIPPRHLEQGADARAARARAASSGGAPVSARRASQARASGKMK